jgi:transcriptional regulator with XRE-family HTH domain
VATEAEVRKRVASRIRRFAKERRIAITHVADRAGVSRAYFFEVLAGRENPTIGWLVKVGEALDIDPGDLLAR